MPINYNDLTAPFEGLNDEWNTEEVNYNTEVGSDNDLTLSVGNPPPGSGNEWNTEE